jgi:phage terminase Nu1 subunit (DNA packaging protein)
MPLTVKQTAAALNRDVATVRRWVAKGCPTASGPGSVGRGRGALLELDQVRHWLGEDQQIEHAQVLQRVARAKLDTLKRDAGQGEPAHRTLGITEEQAAALLYLDFERIARAVTGTDAKQLPDEIAQVRAIALRSKRSNIGDRSK